MKIYDWLGVYLLHQNIYVMKLAKYQWSKIIHLQARVRIDCMLIRIFNMYSATPPTRGYYID